MNQGKLETLVDERLNLLEDRLFDLISDWKAQILPKQKIGLYGELGAGKTSFVRAFARSQDYLDRLTSPTYSLMQVYELSGFRLVHMDLYRLKEADDPGFSIHEFSDDLCFIEWPDKIPAIEAELDSKIKITLNRDNTRNYQLWKIET